MVAFLLCWLRSGDCQTAAPCTSLRTCGIQMHDDCHTAHGCAPAAAICMTGCHTLCLTGCRASMHDMLPAILMLPDCVRVHLNSCIQLGTPLIMLPDCIRIHLNSCLELGTPLMISLDFKYAGSCCACLLWCVMGSLLRAALLWNLKDMLLCQTMSGCRTPAGLFALWLR